MNFDFFSALYTNAEFDEIKVIGKEIEKEGRLYHIVGMTLKEKNATLYIMEFADCFSKEDMVQEKTHRESLKENMESQENQSFFMKIREFQSENIRFEIDGACSGPFKSSDYGEAIILFMKMRQAGWQVAEDSPFYNENWENLSITTIELRDEFETLPEWTDDMQVLIDSVPENFAIELPVLLECGKTMEIEFKLKDSSLAMCYINKIDTVDVWADGEKRFADSEYRERMMQYMTQAEFEQMKEQFFEVLSQHCPKGKHYMVIEYECNKEVGLSFYDREYLDTIEEPHEGSAAFMRMSVKPDAGTGSHGLKLRACVIQKPLDCETKALEAELFSYSEVVQKRIEKL